MPPIPPRANRKLIGWCLLFSAFACLFGFWFAVLRSGNTSVDISLTGVRTNNVGTQQTGFRMVNRGRVLVVWTGTWRIQIKGAPTVVQYSATQISFLGPGATQTVWLPTPTNQGPWRVSFDYRKEDWQQRFKRGLSQYRLGRQLLYALRRLPVHDRHTAASDWVESPGAPEPKP